MSSRAGLVAMMSWTLSSAVPPQPIQDPCLSSCSLRRMRSEMVGGFCPYFVSQKISEVTSPGQNESKMELCLSRIGWYTKSQSQWCPHLRQKRQHPSRGHTVTSRGQTKTDKSQHVLGPLEIGQGKQDPPPHTLPPRAFGESMALIIPGCQISMLEQWEHLPVLFIL